MTIPSTLEAKPANETQIRVYQQRRLAWVNSTHQLHQDSPYHLVESVVDNHPGSSTMSTYSYLGRILKIMDDDPDYDIQWTTVNRGIQWQFFKNVANAVPRIAQYCGISPHVVECLEAMLLNGHANARELHEIVLHAPYRTFDY